MGSTSASQLDSIRCAAQSKGRPEHRSDVRRAAGADRARSADAYALYRSCGFVDIEPYAGSEIPVAFKPYLVFMEEVW